jgi:hypothetical protein
MPAELGWRFERRLCNGQFMATADGDAHEQDRISGSTGSRERRRAFKRGRPQMSDANNALRHSALMMRIAGWAIIIFPVLVFVYPPGIVWGSLPAGSLGGPGPPFRTAGPMPTLQEGSTGNVVHSLQQILTNGAPGHWNTTPGAVESSFGPNTKASVKSFQTWGGVASDGVVGDQTWAVSLHAASATLESAVGLQFVIG